MALAAEEIVSNAITIYGLENQMIHSKKHPESPIPQNSKKLRLNARDLSLPAKKSESQPDKFMNTPAAKGGAVVAIPAAARDNP